VTSRRRNSSDTASATSISIARQAICTANLPRGDIAEVRTGAGKIRLFVAIDRTSKFAYVELHERAGKMIAAKFLRNLIAAVPYRIHTILTDNGICGEGLAA
jgi:tRNA1(Val) A37 N6-methylase TrmN6